MWKERNQPGRRLRAAALAALLLAVTAGAAWGAERLIRSPSADGTIHACFQKKNGQLRIVSEGARCRRSERALEWSAAGPASPPVPPAPPAMPLAFAHVERDGTLDSARSQGVLRIAHVDGSGLYCFDLAAQPKAIAVTNEGFFNGTSAAHISATVAAPTTGMFACPEGYRSAAVLTLSDRPFYVIFH